MTQREPSPAADPPAARRRLGGLSAGRALIALLGVAVLVVTGIGWSIHHRAEAAMAARQVDGALFGDDPNIQVPGSGTGTGSAAGAGGTLDSTSPADPGATPGTSSEGSTVGRDGAGGPAGTTTPARDGRTSVAPGDLSPENILLLGLDTRGAGEKGVGPGTSQSDVIMLVHLHQGHRQVSVLAIPRDLYVPAPECRQWDNATGRVSDTIFQSPYSSWKITNAYAVGGPRCTVQAVQALTGLRVDRLVTIQFEGFKSIVDALGGVTMNFAKPVIDGHQGDVITRAGSQQITGEQALRLVRSRTVKGDPSGDLGRIRRQQAVLIAMMQKMTSSGMATDPGKLDNVLQTFAENSTTANLSVDDMLRLAKMLGGGTNISFATVPTVGSQDSDGLDATAADAQLYAQLRDDQPLR